MNIDSDLLFVAWQNPVTRKIHPLGRLLRRNASPHYEFTYIEGARAAEKEGFIPFLGFPLLAETYRSDELFPLFENRLMHESRPDFREFVADFGLDAGSVGPILILSRSGGRRVTDKIEVFGLPEFDPEANSYIYHFFARGIRHAPDREVHVAQIQQGDRLLWRSEPENLVDKLAIVLERAPTEVVGYIPNYLVEDLNDLIEHGSELTVTVARKNPPPAPAHQRLLCRLQATRKNGFVPFSTPRFRPLSADATSVKLGPAELTH